MFLFRGSLNWITQLFLEHTLNKQLDNEAYQDVQGAEITEFESAKNECNEKHMFQNVPCGSWPLELFLAYIVHFMPTMFKSHLGWKLEMMSAVAFVEELVWNDRYGECFNHLSYRFENPIVMIKIHNPTR